MINGIWVGLILIGIIAALFTGNMESVTEATVNSSTSAVELSIGLIGIMSLWLGLMKIAEEAGIIKAIGNALRPLFQKLFPDIPKGSPALGSITANLMANFFGLGNAATPLGIKAMQDLQEINPNKEEASDAMVMFLAINTSSVTLISTSVIAFRTAANSTNPTEIIAPTIIATTISTIIAIIICKMLAKIPAFRRKLTEKK